MNKRIISLLLVIVMALSLVACGAPAATEAPATNDTPMQYIKAEEAKELLNDAGYVFFDIRKAADSEANSIPGAQKWDMDAAKEGDAEAGKATMTEATKGVDQKIILVCYSGKRYAQAATNALAAIGHDMSKVYTLEGGFTNWSEVYPELTTAGTAAEPAAPAEVPEVSKIRWNYGNSGNVLVFIAQEKGYFAEYGLEIESVPATTNADAMTLLSTGQVDVVSNSGTSNPLQQIASGVDMTIFGGHMVNGCMPVIARPGTEWKGVESFIGKKVAINPSYFAFTGAVMDLGYEDPMDPSVVEWIVYPGYADAMAAVIAGEVDFALQGTGQNLAVNNNPQVEVVCYQSDVMPNYSCCRMECPTEFLEQNPITIKCILKALIKAQLFFENNKQESSEIMAKAIGVELDYVEAFMLNDHYKVHADPLAKSIRRAWGILDATGFLSEDAKNINIDDHINNTIYLEALEECKAEFGAGNEEFFAAMEAFYAENN